MAETVYDKLHWLLSLIEEGKRSLEAVIAENAQLREVIADSHRKPSLEAPPSNPHAAEQVAEVEEQYNTVSNLFVAALQLHSAWTSAEALATLQELLRNFIGATGFELYLHDRTGQHLVSVGLQTFAGRPPPASAEAKIREALGAREARVFSQAPWAVAPILLGAKPAGALVIAELLPHKAALGSGDRDMLQLVSEQLGCVLLRTHRLEKAGLGGPDRDSSLGELVLS